MRLTVSHPVPVRWRPPRARRDRIAYRAEATPVEIPEVAPGTFRADAATGSALGFSRSYAVHDGGAWIPVQPCHLEREYAGAGRAVTLAEAAAFLAGRTIAAAGGLGRAGTPLGGMGLAGAGPSVEPGATLPDAVLRLARQDHAGAARAALARYVARNLATDGEALWMRVCPPVLVPCHTPAVTIELPWYVSRGPAFPPHRADEARRFALFACERTKAYETLKAAAVRVRGLDPALYGELDLDHYLDGAPGVLEHAAGRLRLRLSESGQVLPEPVERALDRLAPLADLGRIGAIAPDRRGEAVDLTLAAARAIRAACPAGYCPESLPWIETYHEHVARPRLAALAPSPPAEDLDGIGRLTP